jgi:hypothetical protein
MIFSNFFKAKWQHKDSNIRLTAINDDLELSNEQDKTILIQLIEQDSHELVRRAALLKINTFEQWLAASKNNSNKKVQEFAHKQIINMLNNEHSIALSATEKQSLLNENLPNAILEPWLHKETDAKLIIALYEKINKPQLDNVLFNLKNEAVQRYLINKTDNVSVLEKWLKKAASPEINTELVEKIAALIEIIEKPKRLTKQVQLLLSKLLALKDLNDYGLFKEKQQTLSNEWLASEKLFECLTSEQAAIFVEKYQQINDQLNKLFAVKEEAFIQQQIVEKNVSDKKQAKQSFDQQLTLINQALTTCVFENTPLDEAEFSKKLALLKDDVQNSVLSDAEQAHYQQLIVSEAQRLSQLPQIAESVSEATHLISKISQLAIPKNLSEFDDRISVYHDWLADWKKVENKTNGILPQYIKAAYKDVVKQWQAGLKPLQQQQKQLFSQTQKKLNDLKRLLSTGKYNASFGVFKRVQASFSQLSMQQQHKLQRDFDSVSAQIKELSDLEHFIATPRKQQLLDEINELITLPLDNVHEQAAKVKQFRQSWNLLGHADEELDKPLNDAFNQACEQAFAPCRLFFAEQEKLREQHFQRRIELIEQAKSLTSVIEQPPVDFKVIDGQLNKLSQAWQESGEVDRAKYKELQQQFSQALSPLKNAIKDFHQINIDKKTKLIDKALIASQLEDVFQAIEQLKELQSQWRTIGYTGPRQENKLWQSFRAINDQLFKKRDALQKNDKEQQSQHQKEFELQLSLLKDNFKTVTTIESLRSLQQQTSELQQNIIDQKPVIKVVIIAVERFIDELSQRSKVLVEQNKQQVWHNVFIALNIIAKNNVSQDDLTDLSEYKALPESWQKKVQASFSAIDNGDRLAKTLELEILSGKESPKEFSQQRMKIQVQLMQEKMSSGDAQNKDDVFEQWLMLGKLTSEDLHLIDRVSVLFCDK